MQTFSVQSAYATLQRRQALNVNIQHGTSTLTFFVWQNPLNMRCMIACHECYGRVAALTELDTISR